MLALYLFWKVWSGDWRLYIPADEIDIDSGLRDYTPEAVDDTPKTWANLPLRIVRGLF